jgi:serine palmitoyltransferase
MPEKQRPVVPVRVALTTLFGYTVLWIIGKVYDFLGSIFLKKNKTPEGYAPLRSDLEDFFTRRLYLRIADVFNRPIAGAPSDWIDVMERDLISPGKYSLRGTTRKCLNLGSYNYLGFGDPDSPCKDEVLKAVEAYSSHTCSSRIQLGTTSLHLELEKTVARFVGKEAAMVFGMGFGTNSTGIPALVGKGGLVISDALNHSSIVTGARSSGASITTFKHNDVKDLERVIRKSICDGQPKSHRPWTKILILIEGIYSMEGEMCPLAEIVAVKKKYKCYLYIDEAHSIGAIGPNGKGICDQKGVDPADVDVMMGTFTKSFGAVGGYLAGSKELIDNLRPYCAGHVHSASISPPAAQQVISAMRIILGEDGTNIGRKKLDALRDNSNYFRERLIGMGCQVLGDENSPVVPTLLCLPGAIACFSRLCFELNIAVVAVGYPATPLLEGRTRFCISAGHKPEDLKVALDRIEEIVEAMGLRYARGLLEFGPPKDKNVKKIEALEKKDEGRKRATNGRDAA